MLITPTGGFIYHLRALRHQGRRWQPFRENLFRWLEGWRPAEKSLLIVGASGGYCLDARFLSRFERLAAVDPDPLAKLIFRRRFGRKVAWSHQDYFAPREGRFDIAGVHRLLADYPDHAVLFSNFLGQVPFIDTRAALSESFTLWKRRLGEALEGRAWASFHDRVSGFLEPRAIAGPGREYPDLVGDVELIDAFYDASGREGLIELSDHLTQDLFPGRSRRFLPWELKPGYWHLIECVRDASN